MKYKYGVAGNSTNNKSGADLLQFQFVKFPLKQIKLKYLLVFSEQLPFVINISSFSRKY